MPFLARILAALGGLAVLSAANWVDRYSSWSKRARREVAAKAASEELAVRRQLAVEEQIREAKKPKPIVRESWRPVIVTKPPFPKVVVENPVFDFGTARVGEQKSHLFKIKNCGEAPLVVSKVPICGHALGDQPAYWQREVQVNQSVDYEMKWHGYEPRSNFATGATFFTNDPLRPMIHPKVFGKIIDPQRAKRDLKALGFIP